MSSANDSHASRDILAQFARIDIYVFDQILRGNITPGMRILDAGCGGGRNSEYLMRCGAEVHGIDADPEAIERIRMLAARVAPALPADNFTVGGLSEIPYPADHFGAVLCSAVLHFAEDETEFERMVSEMWRVLQPGGLFFARLASTIGIEDRVELQGGRWHRLPDGTDRFLVDEAYLMTMTARLGGRPIDPLKTTVVQGMRSMTTWVLRKERA
jgi:2-polyprenyl-3-methyl-5-hydroxy-6-metoxy-1,4-benzoquinol methylase